MLPNFFVAGCQKCATTSLHHYFIQHPELYLPEEKETKYFVEDKRYSKGISYYEKKYFYNINNEISIGEVDPDYIYFPAALKRIAKHLSLKETKFIFIFRNPVDRAFSHYLMTYRRGIEIKSFSDAISCEQERIQKDYFSKMHFSYVDRGFYHQQLLPFLEVLQREQMLFLLTDDLKRDRKEILKKCFEFLGVDPDCTSIETATNYHSATIPRSNVLLNEIVRKQDTLPKKIVRFLIPNQDIRHKVRSRILEANQTANTRKIAMTESERARLIRIYRPENDKLAALLNRDLAHWDHL